MISNILKSINQFFLSYNVLQFHRFYSCYCVYIEGCIHFLYTSWERMYSLFAFLKNNLFKIFNNLIKSGDLGDDR